MCCFLLMALLFCFRPTNTSFVIRSIVEPVSHAKHVTSFKNLICSYFQFPLGVACERVWNASFSCECLIFRSSGDFQRLVLKTKNGMLLIRCHGVVTNDSCRDPWATLLHRSSLVTRTNVRADYSITSLILLPHFCVRTSPKCTLPSQEEYTLTSTICIIWFCRRLCKSLLTFPKT